METNIINVGNSKGIIIPAKFLKMIGLENAVNVEIEGGKIIISPLNKPREGWSDMIEVENKKNGNATSLLPDFFDDEDNDEWTW